MLVQYSMITKDKNYYYGDYYDMIMMIIVSYNILIYLTHRISIELQ
jgi:hypothetical protein